MRPIMNLEQVPNHLDRNGLWVAGKARRTAPNLNEGDVKSDPGRFRNGWNLRCCIGNPGILAVILTARQYCDPTCFSILTNPAGRPFR